MNIVTVAGLSFIKSKLQEHHKHGRKIAAYAMHLEAWVETVEQNANNGNGAYFEIGALESASGHPIVITMPDGTMSALKTKQH